MRKKTLEKRKIEFVYPEQVFKEIVEQLKEQKLYTPRLLYRALLTKAVPTLMKTGNDRDAHYSKKLIEMDNFSRADARAQGKVSIDVDEEAYEICEEFGLKMSDFIFASTEDEIQDYLKYGIGDCALKRLTTQYSGPTSIAIYKKDKFNDLGLHHAWEFRDKTKKGKLEALLKIFDIAGVER